MKSIQSWKKHKWFSLLLMSYFTILIISLVVGWLIYYNAVYIVRQQSIQINNIVVEQSRQELDSHFKDIKNLICQLAMNKRIKKISNVIPPLDTSHRYEIKLLIDEFAVFPFNCDIVEDFAIFFPSNDIIISSSAFYNSEQFYENVFGSKEVPYKDWLEQISKYYSGGFAAGSMEKRGFNNSTVLPYIQSIDYSMTGFPDVNVIVFVNKSKLMSLLGNLEDSYAGNVFYLKINNTIISSGSNTDINTNIFNDSNNLQYHSDKHTKHLKIDEDGVMISIVDSKHINCKYYILSSMNFIMERANNIRNICLYVAIIYIAIGLILALFMTYRNYRPIKRTINLITSVYRDTRTINASNEIIFLQNAFETIINIEREKTNKLKKQWSLLKNSLLNELLKGNIEVNNNIDESLYLCEISFPYKYFCVLVLYSDINLNTEQCNQIKKFINQKICDLESLEYKEFTFKGYFFDIGDNTFTLIINFNSSNIKGYPKEYISQIVQLLKSHFINSNYSFTVSIGGFHDGIDGINVSYKEAIDALGYRIVFGKNSLIFYDDILCTDENYYYPIDIEVKLIECVKVGNINEINHLIDYIFNENFINRHLPLNLIKCLFYDIMSTAIKALKITEIDYKDVFYGTYNPVEELTKCLTIEEIFNVIQDIFFKICCFVNEHRRKQNHLILKVQIEEYIEKNYKDPSLSQIQIAEAFGLSPNYFSVLFKEIFNENMVDYIRKIRLRKAMELLYNTELTITEIATKVGCSNDLALTRIFKKYLHITPGNYRINLKMKQERLS